MDPAPRTCSQCGAPADATGMLAGNCPHCLANQLLNSVRNDAELDRTEVLSQLGDYELLEEIARGGMGIVYRARQIGLDRIVAVKLMRDSAFAGREEIRRFYVEAAAAAKLKHPNIVAVHEVGEQDGLHYFAMQLVEGCNLSEHTRKNPVPPKRGAELMAQAAEAIQHAHEQGVLHRDLKPSNVLIDAAGRPFVTDFGLARSLEADSSLTLTGQVLGTPGYMPPEQAAGKGDIGPAADIYSLGAVLYFLLTGRAPFVGDTPAETLRQVTELEPVSPHLLNPAIPRDLASVCLKCLAKRPMDRYVNAHELAEDLRRFLRGEPTRARPAGNIARLARWCRRRPAVASSLAALVAVALLGLSGILWQWREAVAARDVARAADEQRREQLHQSLSQQASHSRISGQLGHRTNALAAIAAAAALLPTIELRNDALAAMMLPDVGERLWWKDEPSFNHPWCFDFSLDYYLPHIDFPLGEKRRLTVRRSADHGVAADLGEITRQPTAAAFSPDGRFIAARFADGYLRVWEWRTNREFSAVRCGDRTWTVRSFDFAPDHRSLYLASDVAGLCRLDFATDEVAPVYKFQSADVVRVSPSGRQLLAARGNEIQIWNLDLGHTAAHTNFSSFPATGILGAAWHPNEELVALGVEGGLLLWHWPSGVCRAFNDPGAIVPSEPYFNQQGDLLFHQGGVVWDVATQTRLVSFGAQLGGDIALSRDARRIAFQRAKIGFGVWEFLPPMGTHAFIANPFPRGSAPQPDVSPNGQWLATVHGDGWRIWERATSRVLARGPSVHQFKARFASDSASLVTVGRDGLKRWPLRVETESGSGITFGAPELILSGLSPSENWESGSINGDENQPPSASAAQPESGTIARGGRFAVVAGNRHARVADLQSDQISPPIKLRSPDVEFALSRDGRWLVTGLHNRPDQDVWDVWNQTHVTRIGDPPFPACLFHPVTGELAAWNSGQGIAFYEPGSWKLVRRIAWPADSMIAGLVPESIAPAGQLIVGYTSDGQLSLLHDPAGHQFARFERPGGFFANSMGFDARGEQVFIGSGHNTVRQFDFLTLRGGLARLGLDWPDTDPFAFAPRSR